MGEKECNENIGHNLKVLRVKHHLTQSEMAKVLNITTSTLSHYENGLRVPNVELLIEIEKLLDEDIHIIIGDHYR